MTTTPTTTAAAAANSRRSKRDTTRTRFQERGRKIIRARHTHAHQEYIQFGERENAAVWGGLQPATAKLGKLQPANITASSLKQSTSCSRGGGWEPRQRRKIPGRVCPRGMYKTSSHALLPRCTGIPPSPESRRSAQAPAWLEEAPDTAQSMTPVPA